MQALSLQKVMTMAYGTARVQTAFRLPVELVERLKREAQLQGRSLNNYVEEALTRATQAKWPKLPKDYAASPEDLFHYKGHIPSPSQEMLKADPKLAHIWNKGA
jgi:hypothetical protein